MSRPRPRTPVIFGWRAASARSAPMNQSPVSRTRSSSLSASSVSRKASAAAQETGLPPKVEACEPGTKAFAASPRASIAPSGMPPPSDFERVTTSGRTPSASQARKVPVRPRPVCTSSRHEQGPAVGAELRGAREVPGRRHAHAALPLDRLEQHGADVAGDGGLERGEVAVGDVAEAGDERFEALPVLRLPRGGQRGERAAVEGGLRADDDVAGGAVREVRVAAHELDRGLVGLGAAVAEEGAGPGDPGGELLGEPHRPGVAVQVRDVHQRPALLADRPHDRRVAVAEAVDRDPADQVEIGAPLVVEDAAALAAHERQARGVVVLQQDPRGPLGPGVAHRARRPRGSS